MSELTTLELVLVLLAVASLGELYLIRKLIRSIERTDDLLHCIADTVMKEKTKDLMENFHKGLENLFNPKDEIKKDVKRTRTNRKTK